MLRWGEGCGVRLHLDRCPSLRLRWWSALLFLWLVLRTIYYVRRLTPVCVLLAAYVVTMQGQVVKTISSGKKTGGDFLCATVSRLGGSGLRGCVAGVFCCARCRYGEVECLPAR